MALHRLYLHALRCRSLYTTRKRKAVQIELDFSKARRDLGKVRQTAWFNPLTKTRRTSLPPVCRSGGDVVLSSNSNIWKWKLFGLFPDGKTDLIASVEYYWSYCSMIVLGTCILLSAPAFPASRRQRITYVPTS